MLGKCSQSEQILTRPALHTVGLLPDFMGSAGDPGSEMCGNAGCSAASLAEEGEQIKCGILLPDHKVDFN